MLIYSSEGKTVCLSIVVKVITTSPSQVIACEHMERVQVQQHVLAVQLADLRPVRLILGVLNALRSIHLDAITGASGKASQQSREGRAAAWQKARSFNPANFYICHKALCEGRMQILLTQSAEAEVFSDTALCDKGDTDSVYPELCTVKNRTFSIAGVLA